MLEFCDHTILICATCKGAAEASRLRAALSDRIPGRFALRAVDCMAGCGQPVTVGFQAEGKAQYLFGGIQSPADTEALARFAHQYLASETGWTNASERPAQLYDKTLARLPRIKAEAAP
ncbi:DUF1636 family protein [Leisingera sp. ANG-Vp]|uniref:DUF1636 family protein n=1 Tax=Leisingera sp. ANG-Vp TaxID=1577896 RepID=UPI00057FC7BB|nr:DUF1636 family protein [Leisingera sp. ANG-Vp]KIC21458.1 hypothetical protein RA20_03690 [Leisingera sp. ANG-Vp]